MKNVRNLIFRHSAVLSFLKNTKTNTATSKNPNSKRYKAKGATQMFELITSNLLAVDPPRIYGTSNEANERYFVRIEMTFL